MKITLTDTLSKKNKSQYWLAKEAGIAASTINNLCNGKTNRIEFSVLQKICDALKCEVSDIITTDDDYEKRNLHYASKIYSSYSEPNENGDSK